MTWSQENTLTEAIRKHGMELLGFHQTAEWNSLDRFGTQKNIMITVSIALIAAGTAGVAGDSRVIVWAAMLVPMFVAVLRRHTIETLDRYYTRFLEAAVVQRKLRFTLGFGADNASPFSEDKFLEVARRGDNDNDTATGSAHWVREFLGKGHNDVVWRIFRDLCWASAILPMVAGARLYTWPIDAESNSSLAAPGFVAVAIVGSLVALRFAYTMGTRRITKKRDDAHGRLPNKPLRTD